MLSMQTLECYCITHLITSQKNNQQLSGMEPPRLCLCLKQKHSDLWLKPPVSMGDAPSSGGYMQPSLGLNLLSEKVTGSVNMAADGSAVTFGFGGVLGLLMKQVIGICPMVLLPPSFIINESC